MKAVWSGISPYFGVWGLSERKARRRVFCSSSFHFLLLFSLYLLCCKKIIWLRKYLQLMLIQERKDSYAYPKSCWWLDKYFCPGHYTPDGASKSQWSRYVVTNIFSNHHKKVCGSINLNETMNYFPRSDPTPTPLWVIYPPTALVRS